jgi:diacylglycerol kinase family enzyme
MTAIRGVPRTERLAAWTALLATVLLVVTTIALVRESVATLLLVVLLIAVTGAAGWAALAHRGPRRVVAGTVALAALASALVALVRAYTLADLVVLLLAAILFSASARRASGAARRRTRTAPAPARRPAPSEGGVLLLNPRSGGGKVEQLDLATEAARRGIRPVVLGPNDDLQAVARDVVESAAVIGIASGDGSQALVAAIAAEHGVPFVCVPAGTRNHFALDLGLDRSDVLGALDAFDSQIETTIDLAFANDRAFVNNVSLGVYAELVRSDTYRDAKRATAAELLPDLIGARAAPFDLRYVDSGGAAHSSAQLILVANNAYALRGTAGAGSRPRLDGGVLGILAVSMTTAADAAELAALAAVGHAARFPGWDEWTATTFEVDSATQVAAGIDGEAVTLEAPLRFRLAPKALRVRLPPSSAGRSRAALRPHLDELWSTATRR